MINSVASDIWSVTYVGEQVGEQAGGKLSPLAADELVIRSSNDRNVRNLGIRFLAPDGIEMTTQEGQVIGRWKHIIVSKPDRPETAREPAVPL